MRSLNGTATLAARWPVLPQKERCVKYKHPPRKPTWLSFYFIFPPPANIPHPIPLSPVPWKSNWFHDLRRHFATFCVSIARSTPVFLFLLSILLIIYPCINCISSTHTYIAYTDLNRTNAQTFFCAFLHMGLQRIKEEATAKKEAKAAAKAKKEAKEQKARKK